MRGQRSIKHRPSPLIQRFSDQQRNHKHQLDKKMSLITLPELCNCIPRGSTEVNGDNILIVSVTFDPGCSVCATCTCQPISMDPLEDNPWGVYVSSNECLYCFAVDSMAEPCGICNSTDLTLCDCFFARLADIEKAENEGEHKIRRRARVFMEKLRALKKDKRGRIVKLSRRITGRGRA